jgi:hypothetical protein
MESATPTNLGTTGEPVVSTIAEIVRAQKRLSSERIESEWSEQDRQWDIRINLGPGDCSLQDARTELEWFLDKCKAWEKIKYIFVGGIEIGANPSQDDYKRFHVHAALILFTPNTRRSVVHNLCLSVYSNRQQRSYYLAKRNPFASFTGWRNHHAKEATKVEEELIALEWGEPPKEYNSQLLKKGEPGKLKQDDMLREIMQLFAQGKKDIAFQEYPALTLRYHAQITSMVKTRLEQPVSIDHTPCLWIWGEPGTGKSAYVAWKYPKAFKKSLAKNEVLYWNGIDLDWHTHVYIEDIGPEAFKNIGMEQLKQWADPSHGYTISLKYGAPIMGVTLGLIITSNYRPGELPEDDMRYKRTEMEAIERRFEIIHINDLLKREKLSLKSKEEIKELKKAKNADFSKVFNHLS